MAKSRMAGEALSNTQRNRQTREEIGNSPERLAERISIVDRNKFDLDGYTDKEINMALQGGTFGDEDYARLTGQSAGGGDNKPEEVKPPSPAPTPNPDPEPSPIAPTPEKPDITIPVIPVGPGGGGGQYVNQNNDINTNITGDNNTVDNNQDNSVSQGGGDYASSYARGLKNQYVLNLLGK